VEIDQVVANLVENAIKYTPPAATIRVAADIADDELRVVVEDTGGGLRHDAFSRLFEPFYRAAQADRAGGSGLGLAIARGLILAHGGRIWAENRPEGGARFTFTLPAPAVPAEATP
jgi:signal transduction histidine kinase